jgi:hypothetical protein
VTSQTELIGAFAIFPNGEIIINFENDITLTKEIAIDTMTGVEINGNGFKLDGNKAVRCLKITSSVVSINNLVITGGLTTDKVGHLLILEYIYSVQY